MLKSIPDSLSPALVGSLFNILRSIGNLYGVEKVEKGRGWVYLIPA